MTQINNKKVKGLYSADAKAEVRKELALEECLKRDVLNMDMFDGFKVRKEIEEMFNVNILVEKGHCISVWTARTPIIKHFA